jgi:hypothetical protein
MKLLSFKSLITPSALAFASVLTAFAPVPPVIAQAPVHIVVDVPFDFRSNSEVMPAGKYDIQALSDHLLAMRGQNGSRSQALLAIVAQTRTPSARGKVIFHRYGNKYFLYQMWLPNEVYGFEFPKGHAEKEAILAANTPAPTNTELALNKPIR